MDPLTIAGGLGAGLSSLKTAADLLKLVREGLKSGEIKQDELAGRIGEIYDCIGDSKDSLLNAKEQIQNLNEEVRDLKAQLKQRAEMKHAEGVYWTRDDGPFCRLCWELPPHLKVRLTTKGVTRTADGFAFYECEIHIGGDSLIPRRFGLSAAN